MITGANEQGSKTERFCFKKKRAPNIHQHSATVGSSHMTPAIPTHMDQMK
jgi:hypothetical protein